jgi:hypothetical protein
MAPARCIASMASHGRPPCPRASSRRPRGRRRAGRRRREVRPLGMYPFSGSWALVWSVTKSGRKPRATSSGYTSAALPTRPMETASPRAQGVEGQGERLVEGVGRAVEVAGLEALLDPRRVDLDHEADAVVHGDRESGCAPPMPPRPAVRVSGSSECAAEVLAGRLGEGLVGALEDALGADVDPGSRRSSDRTSSGPAARVR